MEATKTDEECVTLRMIPIYLFNASPWGSLTKGYRLLNLSSQREMREKNPYSIERWKAFLSSCIIHASWSLSTSNSRFLATREQIFREQKEYMQSLYQIIMSWCCGQLGKKFDSEFLCFVLTLYTYVYVQVSSYIEFVFFFSFSFVRLVFNQVSVLFQYRKQHKKK